MDKIKIPFGAYDSETLGWTYTIPKGYTAKIEDGKIVVKKEELEDEKIKKSLVKFLKSLPIKHRCEYAASELENWLAWLEKQKATNSEKPKEWSEEDEDMIGNIICILQKDITYTSPTRPNSCTGSGNAFYTHQTEIDWLKSLLPQPHWKPNKDKVSDNLHPEEMPLTPNECHWKPSEEQMSALNYFIKLWGNSDDQLEYTKIFNTVKSLRDDLEKLM